MLIVGVVLVGFALFATLVPVNDCHLCEGTGFGPVTIVSLGGENTGIPCSYCSEGKVPALKLSGNK